MYVRNDTWELVVRATLRVVHFDKREITIKSHTSMSLKKTCKLHPYAAIEDSKWRSIPCWECDPDGFAARFSVVTLAACVEQHEMYVEGERQRELGRKRVNEIMDESKAKDKTKGK